MRRVLLISLSLVMALVGWSTVRADDGFYVIAGQRANYSPVPKTGQTTSYAAGDDGALRKGVASPTQRFNDNNNGTVTDNLTGLIWMKHSSNVDGALGFGRLTWDQALSAAATLANGAHGLSDGSKAGDWRLPNVRELISLIDYGERFSYALPAGHPFTGVQGNQIWTSTTCAKYAPPTPAWAVSFGDGEVAYGNAKTNTYYVWCVRGGK
jgi:hypothetical protein